MKTYRTISCSTSIAGHGARCPALCLGLCIAPAFRALSGGHDQLWIALALFAGLLIALRVLPGRCAQGAAVLRGNQGHLVPAPPDRQAARQLSVAKAVLDRARPAGLAAIGGGLQTGEQVVTVFCLIGGARRPAALAAGARPRVDRCAVAPVCKTRSRCRAQPEARGIRNRPTRPAGRTAPGSARCR